MRIDVFKLAIESGVADDSLSGDGQIMTDCGCATAQVHRLVGAVLNAAAEVIESQDIDPSFKGRMAWAIRDLLPPLVE